MVNSPAVGRCGEQRLDGSDSLRAAVEVVVGHQQRGGICSVPFVNRHRIQVVDPLSPVEATDRADSRNDHGRIPRIEANSQMVTDRDVHVFELETALTAMGAGKILR